MDSSVLKWPDARSVVDAFRRWAERARTRRDDVVRIGHMRSYARGEAGVGSDLDVLVVVSGSDLPFERRLSQWDLTGLPVAVDVLVYTAPEWAALVARDDRFAETIRREAVWL